MVDTEKQNISDVLYAEVERINALYKTDIAPSKIQSVFAQCENAFVAESDFQSLFSACSNARIEIFTMLASAVIKCASELNTFPNLALVTLDSQRLFAFGLYDLTQIHTLDTKLFHDLLFGVTPQQLSALARDLIHDLYLPNVFRSALSPSEITTLENVLANTTKRYRIQRKIVEMYRKRVDKVFNEIKSHSVSHVIELVKSNLRNDRAGKLETLIVLCEYKKHRFGKFFGSAKRLFDSYEKKQYEILNTFIQSVRRSCSDNVGFDTNVMLFALAENEINKLVGYVQQNFSSIVALAFNDCLNTDYKSLFAVAKKNCLRQATAKRLGLKDPVKQGYHHDLTRIGYRPEWDCLDADQEQRAYYENTITDPAVKEIFMRNCLRLSDMVAYTKLLSKSAAPSEAMDSYLQTRYPGWDIEDEKLYHTFAPLSY